MKLEGSTFIVTGGGSGLGAATTRILAGGGANVVIADVDEQSGDETATGIGSSARFVRTDVTEESDVRAAIDLAASEFGGLHGLVNCAGIGPASKVIGRDGAHSLEMFTKVVTVNMIGTFNAIRLAAEKISEGEPNGSGERGVIINTASVAAFDGQIGQSAYSASKGGIVGMTLPIARELARHGIRVMTIAPGLFETPLLAGLPEDVRDSLGKQAPFPSRLGQPEEYAALARHIVENEMLNGEVIRLDGAIRMQPK